MTQARGVRLGALVLLVGMWAVADRDARSAPQLAPKCDTKCRDSKGPFVEGTSESGKCFVYTEAACNSCFGEARETNGYICSEAWDSAGAYCRTVFVLDEFEFPKPINLGKDPIVNEMDPDAPCSKHCPMQAPGFEAKLKIGSAPDAAQRQNILLAACNVNPPPPPEPKQ